MANASQVELGSLESIGSDPELQKQFREVVVELSKNSTIADNHSQDWAVTTESADAGELITESLEHFIAELENSYPIYTVFREALKMSFISKKDGRYWQCSVTKTAFLNVRQALS